MRFHALGLALVYLHIPALLFLLTLFQHNPLFSAPDLGNLAFLCCSTDALFTHIQLCETFLALPGVPEYAIFPTTASLLYTTSAYALAWAFLYQHDCLGFGLIVLPMVLACGKFTQKLLGIYSSEPVRGSIRAYTVLGGCLPLMLTLVAWHGGFYLIAAGAVVMQIACIGWGVFRDLEIPPFSVMGASEDAVWLAMMTILGHQIAMVFLVIVLSHDGHWLEKALAVMWGFGWCASEWMVVHRLQVVGMDMRKAAGGPGVHEPLLAAEAGGGESPDLYA